MATKEMKFEEKIKELEKIINELESGNADLEDSIEKYTKAMKLVKECDEQLKNVEDAIAKIVLENGETENLKLRNNTIGIFFIYSHNNIVACSLKEVGYDFF